MIKAKRFPKRAPPSDRAATGEIHTWTLEPAKAKIKRSN